MSDKINYFFCPECGNIPSITLYNKGYAGYTCDCKKHGMMLASEMLKTMKTSEARSINTKCLSHDKQYTLYCKTCSQHLCEDCQSSHENHTLKNLTSTRTNINVDSIRNFIEASKEQMKFELMTKDRLISRLKQEITKLENSYASCSSLSNNFLDFMENMLKSFEQINTTNYHIMNNIIENNKFNIEEHLISGEDFFGDIQLMIDTWENKPVMRLPTKPPSQPEPKVKISTLTKAKEISAKIEHIYPLKSGKLFLVNENSECSVINPSTWETELKVRMPEITKIRDIAEISNNKLIFCSLYSYIYVVELTDTTLKLVEKIETGRGDVIAALEGNKFAVTSNETGGINIYSSNGPVVLETAFRDAHLGEINSIIQLKDGRMVSGAGANDDDIGLDCVKFWDIDTYVPLPQYTVGNVVCYTRDCLCEVGKKLIIGNCYSCVVVSLETYVKEFVIQHNIMKYTHSIHPVENEENSCMVVSTSNDSSYNLMQFNIETGKVVNILKFPDMRGFSSNRIHLQNGLIMIPDYRKVTFFKLTTSSS